MRYLWLFLLIPGWLLQYSLVVPAVWFWRYLILPAFKLGAIGVLLLFIPIIGWIVLAILILRRSKPERDNRYLSPWGKTLIGGTK